MSALPALVRAVFAVFSRHVTDWPRLAGAGIISEHRAHGQLGLEWI